MSQEARVDKLEAVVGQEPDGEAPVLTLLWPEDETRETLAEQARVRAWFRKHGGQGEYRVVVDWSQDDLPDGAGKRDD